MSLYSYKVLESFKNGITQIEQWDNSIIYFKLDDYSETQLEDSVFQHAYLKSKFDGTHKLLILNEPGKYATISKEAREFATNPKNNSMTLASAVIIKNLAQRILISFMINVTQKSNMKMRLFEDKEKAIEWLLSLKEIH